MKRFLIFLGALFIMQTYASLADSANDTIWKKGTHYLDYLEFSPTNNYFLSRGEELLNGSDRKGIIIFNTEGDTIKVINSSEGLDFIMDQGIWDAHFSKDGRFMVVIWEYYKDNVTRGMLEIFETENWTSIKKIDVPGDSFSLLGAKCLISPDNRIVTAKTLDGLYLYDAISGELLKELWDYGQDLNKNHRVIILQNSNDGQYIYFTATDNKLRYLNTNTFQIDYTRQDETGFTHYGNLTVSNSGNLLANSAGLNELRVINPHTKETILSIPVYTMNINSMVFSPDERYLAVSFGLAKVIRVYDLQTGKDVYQYTTVPSGYGLGGVSISLDQKYLVTSSGNFLYFYKFLPTTGVEYNPKKKEDTIYPNPTNGNFSIQFDLPKAGLTIVQVYDNTGKNVKQVFQGHLERGEQNIQGDIRGLKTGNYFVKVSAPGTEITFKLIINN